MGWMAERDRARSRLRRRGYPIIAYVGPNGSGKSAIAVYDSMLSLDYGRPVLSTVRLLDFRRPRPCPGGSVCDDPVNHWIKRTQWSVRTSEDTGTDYLHNEEFETGEEHKAAHPFYRPLRDYRDLMEWRDGDVLMDEVTGVASSRESSSMPVQVANYLVQLRRRNIVLRWTTPSWGRADKIIREVTQSVTYMVGRLPQSRPTPAGEAPRVWRDNRVLHARSYDPLLMEEFEAHRVDNIPAEATAYYWGPNSLVRHAYDTLDPVSSLGWANDQGMCMSCGGKRSLAKCACGTAHGGAPGAGAKRATGAPAPIPVPSEMHPLIAATSDQDAWSDLVLGQR